MMDMAGVAGVAAARAVAVAMGTAEVDGVKNLEIIAVKERNILHQG